MKNLTVSMAAKYMKREPQALYLAIRKGRLKAKKIDDQWFLTMKDIEEYMSDRYSNEIRKSKGQLIWDSEKGEISVPKLHKMIKEKATRKLSHYAIYHKINIGEIQAFKKGSHWILTQSEASRFLQSLM